MLLVRKRLAREITSTMRGMEPMDVTSTLQAVKALPQADQPDLVFQLWDQLVDGGWQPDLTDELEAELDRRIAAHEADPSRAVTWEQVLEHVRRPGRA
jgi:putative addiction module component (TIGR02574 family)